MERKGQRQNQLRGEGGTRLGMFKTGGRGGLNLGGQAREVGGFGVDKQDQLSHRGVRGIDTRERGEVPG